MCLTKLLVKNNQKDWLFLTKSLVRHISGDPHIYQFIGCFNQSVFRVYNNVQYDTWLLKKNLHSVACYIRILRCPLDCDMIRRA